MKIIIIFFFVFAIIVFPQPKLVKWGKAEINYALPEKIEKRDSNVESENAGELVSKTFIMAYWFFISDVDGDNCPFYPSCSGFFIESVMETNLVQGTLMFFDRFTRDMNFVNRSQKYPGHISGKYFDPPVLYSLQTNSSVYNLHDNYNVNKTTN